MSEKHGIVFYDGSCGLCHGFVTFVLKHDPNPGKFDFSPLQGETLKGTVPPEVREGLPDSIVVYTSEEEVLVRSRAIFFVCIHLGGLWGVGAKVLGLIPTALSDLGYRLIAAVRYRVFRRPEEACPLVPAELRARFLP